MNAAPKTPSATSAFSVGLQYEVEGAIHEAGHAIMYAPLGLPFHSVTVAPDEEEGSAGMVRSVPKGMPGRLLSLHHQGAWRYAVASAAGRAATDLRNQLIPEDPIMHFPESDIHDLENIREYAAQLKIANSEEWCDTIAAQVRHMLGEPYVWTAVDELAYELLMSGGDYEIPAKHVRSILREAKKARALQQVRCDYIENVNRRPA
jgi:hypothetical protein